MKKRKLVKVMMHVVLGLFAMVGVALIVYGAMTM